MPTFALIDLSNAFGDLIAQVGSIVTDALPLLIAIVSAKLVWRMFKGFGKA